MRRPLAALLTADAIRRQIAWRRRRRTPAPSITEWPMLYTGPPTMHGLKPGALCKRYPGRKGAQGGERIIVKGYGHPFIVAAQHLQQR